LVFDREGRKRTGSGSGAKWGYGFLEKKKFSRKPVSKVQHSEREGKRENWSSK